MKKNEILLRLKDTAKLEALIAQGADYDAIVKQSQKIDEYIVKEMRKINQKNSACTLK